jgi:transposase
MAPPQFFVHLGEALFPDHGTYWFVSIQVQREVDEPMLKIGAAAGGDLGVINALTLSDGMAGSPT